MSEIHISGNVAFLEGSGSAVFFSKSAAAAGTFSTQGSAPQIKQMQTALKVAYWGEDNRFPQNIEQQMAYCGIGKAALNWSAAMLYGDGIVPGKIIDHSTDPVNGKVSEVFQQLSRSEGKEVYAFLENRAMFRFWIEYFQDWKWFGNCFPEAVFSKEGNKITHFVHQESCDARFKQMNEESIIDTVYLSKMWGTVKSQFARFDPEKAILAGYLENPQRLTEIDNKFLKAIDAIDMYNPLESAKNIAEKLTKQRGVKFKSAIFPVNFPSPNKTYYQVPAWDGARLGGWVEIASKVPAIVKAFLNKGLKVRNHIEIPDSYFPGLYGTEVWNGMKQEKKQEAKKKLLRDMDEFLTSEKADFSTFISFFQYDKHAKAEYDRIKITPIEQKYSADKELINSSAADLQILASMNVHPTLFGAGTIGTGSQRTGGSDQREAFLIYCAMLKLEREVALEPLYLARDFNGWDPEIVFRIRDIQLTTLDKNTGTTKTLS